MNRIVCLSQIEKELNELGCKLINFITRDGVIEINFQDEFFNNHKFYIAYRYMTPKTLHDRIIKGVIEQ